MKMNVSGPLVDLLEGDMESWFCSGARLLSLGTGGGEGARVADDLILFLLAPPPTISATTAP